MKKIFWSSMFLIWGCFVTNLYSNIFDEINLTFKGIVIKVYDGDTLTLKVNNNKVKIRLYGIDAPELKQFLGIESRDFLKQKCLEKKVEIKVKNVDKYGRFVGIVFCDNLNTSINLLSLQNGWSYTYKEFLNPNDDEFLKSENYAKENKKGVWEYNNLTNPSEFRKTKKNKTQKDSE